MYEYNATFRSNYDGDTVRLDIDLGFGVILRNQTVRLLGINAPELRGETLGAARMSRDVLLTQLSAVPLTIRTVKDTKEKYGRWLATIHKADGTNVNEWMVEKGYAVEADY